MSGAQLAEAIGAGTRNAVSLWETGARTPQIPTIVALAQALDITTAELIGPPANLAELRARSGLSQKQVAAAIGVAQSRYSILESGRARPSDDQVIKLASAFGCDIAQVRSLLEQ